MPPQPSDILSYFPSSNGPWQVDYGTRFQQWCREAGNTPAGRENTWRALACGDVFYKCQINHPADSDIYAGVPPTLSNSISLSLPFFPCFFLLWDAELSLRQRAVSDKNADGAEGFRLLMTYAKTFYFLSLEVTNRKRNVHKAAMNHVTLTSEQSLNCLHSLWWDWQLQSSFSKKILRIQKT